MKEGRVRVSGGFEPQEEVSAKANFGAVEARIPGSGIGVAATVPWLRSWQ